MKTSFKTFAFVLAFVASAFAANADDKESKKASFGTGIYPTKAGKINVLVDKADASSNTVLLLKNASGDVIYRETVDKGNKKFGRSLNVDAMEAGEYKLDVISGKEVQTKTFQVSEQVKQRVLTVK